MKLLALLAALLPPTSAAAKRVNHPIAEWTREADVVAVVHTGRSQPTRNGIPGWRVTGARVLQLLKGSPPGRQLSVAYNARNSEDPSSVYRPGQTWLVFLRRDPAGPYSTRVQFRVRAGQVDFWPESGKSEPLRVALARVKAYIRAEKQK